MDKIEKIRIVIDEIDQDLMLLLEERFSLSVQIGILKSHTKTSILDVKREDAILEKVVKYSHSPEIDTVYRTIMRESKSIQRK